MQPSMDLSLQTFRRTFLCLHRYGVSQIRRRLDSVADPLIGGISEPYPFSSGFSTGKVLAKALVWQQEIAARVRKYQEEPDI
jgi:hypothetical protein